MKEKNENPLKNTKKDHWLEQLAIIYLLPTPTEKKVFQKTSEGIVAKTVKDVGPVNQLTLDKYLPRSMLHPLKPSKRTREYLGKRGEYLGRKRLPPRVYNKEGDLINPRSPDWKSEGKHTNRRFAQEKKFEKEQLKIRRKLERKLNLKPQPVLRKFDLTPKQKYIREQWVKKYFFKRRIITSKEQLKRIWEKRRKMLFPPVRPPTYISKRNFRNPKINKISKKGWERINERYKKYEQWIKEDNRRIFNKNISQTNEIPNSLQDIYRNYLDLRLYNAYKIPKNPPGRITGDQARKTKKWLLFEQEIQCGRYTYESGHTKHKDVFNEKKFKMQMEYSMDKELITKEIRSFFDPHWLIRFYIPRYHIIFLDKWLVERWRRNNSPDEPFYLTGFSPFHLGIRQGWNSFKIEPVKDMKDPNMPNVVPAMIRFLRDQKIPFEIYPCSIFQAVQPEAKYSKEDVKEIEERFCEKFVDWKLIKIESERLFVKFMRSLFEIQLGRPNPYKNKALFSQEWRDYVNGSIKYQRRPKAGKMRFHVEKYYELSYSDEIPRKYMMMPYTLFKDFIIFSQLIFLFFIVLDSIAYEIWPEVTPQARIIWKPSVKGPANILKMFR